jgi:uncharacterized protein YkwD
MAGLQQLPRRAAAASLALAIITSLLAPISTSASAASDCQFVLGFKALHDLDPADVGSCTSNQTFAGNGDAVQPTSRGLLVWRKADNATAFTNGYRTWVNGPFGLQERLNTDRFPWEAPDGAAASPGSAAAPSTSTLAGMSAQLFSLLNADRQSNGLAPLVLNSQLSGLARVRAQGLLAGGGALNHYDASGNLVLRQIIDGNQIPYATAGENLAENNFSQPQTVAVANAALMNSPTHRANILNPAYQQVGIGLAGPDAGGTYVYVQLFLQPARLPI